MSPIEQTSVPSTALRSSAGHARVLVLASLAVSVLLAVAALVLTDAADGWRVAAEMVSRFSVLVFVVALGVEPMARLFPHTKLRAVAREQDSLMFAFVAAFAGSLVCVLAPSTFGSAVLLLPAIFYCGLNGAILVVMCLSYNPASNVQLSAASWRAMQRIATGYFWLAFTMWDVGRLRISDHPDSWYGFSLLLLLGVAAIRLTRRLVARQRGRPVAEKVA